MPQSTEPNVHVIPSSLYATPEVAESLSAVATNFPFPYTTAFQSAPSGKLTPVHVTPSAEYAAVVPPPATATKVLFPYATSVHYATELIVNSDHDVPFVEYTASPSIANAINLSYTHLTFVQNPDKGNVTVLHEVPSAEYPAVFES